MFLECQGIDLRADGRLRVIPSTDPKTMLQRFVKVSRGAGAVWPFDVTYQFLSLLCCHLACLLALLELAAEDRKILIDT